MLRATSPYPVGDGWVLPNDGSSGPSLHIKQIAGDFIERLEVGGMTEKRRLAVPQQMRTKNEVTSGSGDACKRHSFSAAEVPPDNHGIKDDGSRHVGEGTEVDG
jgi:hypothetical protein